MDKPIKINVNNPEKIQKLLDEAQMGCRARTVDAEDVVRASFEADERLTAAGVPLTMRQGAWAAFCPAKVANSYKGIAEGTMVGLQRGSKNWFVASIRRVQTGSCPHGADPSVSVGVNYNPTLLDAMARHHGIEISRTQEQQARQNMEMV